MVNVAEFYKKMEAYLKRRENLDPKRLINSELKKLIQEQRAKGATDSDLLLKNMEGHGESRYGVRLDVELAANVIVAEPATLQDKKALNHLAGILNKINNAWYNKVKAYLEEAMDHLAADVRY